MEFLIFRMLRLIDREIEMYENLYTCLNKQHANILEGKVLDLMVDMIEQNEIMTIISDIEKDIKDDTVDLCSILKIFSKELNITVVVDALQDKYPKFCNLFQKKGNKLNELLISVEKLNSENISLLRNYKTIWKDIIPLYSAWTDCNYTNENETEKTTEPVYEFSLN